MALANLLKMFLQDNEDDMSGGGLDNEVSALELTMPKRPKPEAPIQQMEFDANPQFQTQVPSFQATPSLVQGPREPTLNYNNSWEQEALGEAMKTNRPRGGSANPGIYGLLPEKMQHGTLRNVLGAIGDAFLVQSGNAPTYAPRMQRQAIGAAMAGLDPNDPASVQAAIQRVAMTGSPESIELADRMQKDFGNTELRKQSALDTKQYRQSQVELKKETALTRRIPFVGAMVRNANTPEAYAAAFKRADQLAKSIDPSYDATDFGLIAPEDWTPEAAAAAGLTANNMLSSQDRGLQRQTSERNTDVNAASRIQAAGIGANSRMATAELSADKATGALILQGLIEKQNSGQSLTPAEQATFNKMTNVGGRTRSLPAGLAVGGAPKAPAKASPAAQSIPPAAVKQLKPGKVTTFANGQSWTLSNGKPKRVK